MDQAPWWCARASHLSRWIAGRSRGAPILVRHEGLNGSFLSVGPASGGPAEVAAAGGMDATPTTIGGLRGLPATRGVERIMRRRLLAALAGHDGAGRDRVALSLEAVICEGRLIVCASAQGFPVELVRVLGADSSQGIAVEAWRSAQARVVQLVSPRRSSSLDQVAVEGSSTLGHCTGGVDLFPPTVGPAFLVSQAILVLFVNGSGPSRSFQRCLNCFI